MSSQANGASPFDRLLAELEAREATPAALTG